ncbi:MAG: hypothetical protein RIS48_1373, partial [Pseudomonadota bacterium]
MSDYQAQAAASGVPSSFGSGAGGEEGGRRLRVAVIGLGIGRMHIEGWRQHPAVDVIAIADPDPLRLQQVGEQFGIERRYPDLASLLAAESVDAVSICTPNKFHQELTLAALAAGCHVLCEKPMAMSAAEGREMVAAAQAAGKR